jgi:CRISPR-associated endonuclease/helicase Cas3
VLNRYFYKITGFEPYCFQVKVCKALIDNKSVIINAPTGSGKTWAAITPFLFSWQEWKKGYQRVEDFPKKLIYSLPVRALANSLYKEVKDTIEKKMPELGIKVVLQTGESPYDAYFEGDIIFTTIDQTLSNILGIPLALSTKQANINAGAVLSAYLVFDEFHLLDPQKSLNTVIQLLKTMKEITPFCIMTATLTNGFMRSIAKSLNAEIVQVGKEDYKKFKFVVNNSRKIVRVIDRPLNVEDIINNHKQKTIVICNTVDRCIEIYKELSQKKVDRYIQSELICIHSQFFHRHRQEKENLIRQLFSEKIAKNVILVTTQVVEVGLDISCDVMHTEISPINSFLQRAGRCARWGGEGKIYVYDVLEKGYKYAPYTGKLQEICKSTFEYLKTIQNNNLDYFTSLKAIERILKEYESSLYIEIENNSHLRWDKIRTCWLEGGKEHARELIRDISSINIVLLPAYYRTDSLYKYEALSINPHSLESKIRKLIEDLEGEIPNFTFRLEESSFDDFDSLKELTPIPLEKIFMENIIALNSDLVGYSKDWGLDFSREHIYQSCLYDSEKRLQFAIKQDTMKEHLSWMLEIYRERFRNSLCYPFKKIQLINYKAVDLHNIIKFIILMHDYGKLNKLWQKIANEYQALKWGKDKWKEELLAHTDFDPNNSDDNKIYKFVLKKYKLSKPPNHSGVGAIASVKLLPECFELSQTIENKSLVKVALTTILRHHAAYTTYSPNFEISKEGVEEMNKLFLEYFPQFKIVYSNDDPIIRSKKQNLKSFTIQFANPIEAFLYFLFVRVLRLCDQRSFEKNPLYHHRGLTNE